MRLNGRKLLACLALTIAIGVGSAGAQVAPATATIPAVTEPSKRSNLNFPAMGVIRQVVVKEGDRVRKDQVLIEQDDEVEAAEYERLKQEAESRARIEFAEADRDHKRAVYERKSKAEGGVFSAMEVEEAKLDMIQRDKQIEVTELDQRGNQIKAKQQGVRVDKMKLRSPFDGIVAEIKAWEGELGTPDPDKPAVLVVQNDPCHVIIRELRTWQVARLNLGETMEVKYPDDKEWRHATIVYISPVGDAGSDTQLVKLELPNPENKATGLPIQVKLPAKLLPQQTQDRAAMR